MEGTADVDTDYFGSSHQVVFSSGESRACVSIPIADDDECEVTESFSVKLSEPTIPGTYFLGHQKSCSAYIDDNDKVEVSFQQATYMVKEESQNDVQICLVAACPCPARMTVRMSMSPGTAEAGSDYPEQSLSISFDVGEEVSCTTVKVIDDVIPEKKENFTVALQVLEGYNIGTPGNITICITDRDLSCSTPLEPRGTQFMNVDENSTWYVASRLTYSCEEGFHLLDSEGSYQGEQAVGVCTESGSWRFDSHCQDINECEDTNPCDSETEKCTNTIGNYSCSCLPGYSRNVQGICKEIIVQLIGCPYMANEDDEAISVCAMVSIPFGEKTAVTLLLMDETADVGLDYSGNSHQVVFSPGESQACVSIPMRNDDKCEVTESFSVKLTEPSISGTYLLGQPKSCLVSIKDDEKVELSFQHEIYKTKEESDLDVQVCLVSSCPCPARMTVRMLMSPGTAEAGSDYPQQSLSVTFDVGEEEACTTVKVTDDVIPEEQESFEVALQVNEHYNIGNPGYTMIVISDEDVLCQEPLEPRGTQFMNVDGNSTWYVGSRLTYSCEEGFQLLDSEGSYQGEQALGICTESGSWKFDSHCQDINECDDNPCDAETEKCTNSIGNYTCTCLPGYSRNGQGNCQEIIAHLVNCPVVTDEDNKTANVCAMVSVPFNKEIVMTLVLADGTAELGSDFFESSHQIAFTPGQSQACVSIPIADDDECEVDEWFSLKLSEPTIAGTYFLGQPKSCLVSIKDNEKITVSFQQSTYVTNEDDKEIEICLVSSCPCPARMTVRMSIIPGTAEAGSDYPEQSLSVSFDVGEEEACTTVRVTDDVIPEEQESFEVALQVNEVYDIGGLGKITIFVNDKDTICGPPPILTGMEYIDSNQNRTWYTGDKIQLICKQGYELLDDGGNYRGLQGQCTCSESRWNYDSFCYDKPECTQTIKICEKHCREIEGSYQCFCDSDEKLDENGFSCNKECGHIKIPSGVDQPRINNNNGFKRADLSCRKTDYVFAGEKDPTPQYCFKGQWTYEAEDYDIPGCQAVMNSSVFIDFDSPQPNKTCDPNEPLEVDPLDFDSFFGEDSETEAEVTATCESTGRKRSTGHIVLHFSVKKMLSPTCSDARSCVAASLRSLRPAALAVFNAVKSNTVQVTVTADDERQSFFVNSVAKWKRIAQGCGKGSEFVNNQCVPCAPGNFYDVEEKACQFCPLSHYQDESGRPFCVPCPSGKITRRKGTNSPEGCIVACQPGQYSTEGDGYEPCNLCPDGTWQNETGQSYCYKCDYGKPTGRKGATSSSECDCPKGTFGQNCSSSCICKNSGICLKNGFCTCAKGWSGDDCSHRVPCDRGSFFNSTRNSCQFCPVSQYQDDSSQTYCKTCPNGKTTEILGTTSKDGCITLCAPGSFHNLTNDTCQLCPLTRYQDESNRKFCKSCPHGTITRNIGAVSLALCIAKCQPGEYSNEGDGYEPCSLCPDGSWQNETGESFCYQCERGHFTHRSGATSDSECASCAPGSFYNLTRNECQYCPLSQYQNESGQTSCIPCPNGTITRIEGANSADVCNDECQPGEYSTEGDGYGPCNLCPDGSWQNETGESFCYQCEIGHVTRKEGATSGKDCVPCAPGSFYNVTENICQFCPLTQYQDEMGQTSCKTCPNRKFTRRRGTTSIDGCLSCDSFCYPGVECMVDENEHIACGSCPVDLTGNGVECHPACAGSTSNVYLISFLPNYRAENLRSIMMVSSYDANITDVTKITKKAYPITAGSLKELTKPSTIQPTAICTDTNVDLITIGINKETGSIDAFLTFKLSNVLKASTFIIITPEDDTSTTTANNFIITAFYNNTEVEVISYLKVSYSISGSWSSKSNMKYTLNSLDYLSITAKVDLTGTEIHANKPASVFSGHHCANIPIGVRACDHAVEQIPPVSRWGQHLVVTAFQRNVPGDIVKIVASENSTKITVKCLNDTLPEVLEQKVLNGNEHLSFQLPSNGTCVINSSHPILAAQFSTGSSLSPTSLGDPSMTIVPNMDMYFKSGRARFISPISSTTLSDRYMHFVNIYIYYPLGVNITTPTIDGVSLPNNENFQQIIVGQPFLPDGVNGTFHIFKGTVAGGLHVIETNGHVAAIVYGYRTWEMYSYTVNY